MHKNIKTKLLIADDHKYLIDGVRLALEDSQIHVVAHSMDVDQVLPLYAELKPDAVLLDIKFGQLKSGIDVLQEILEQDPKAKVLIFSQYDQDELVQKAYLLGAMAFLPKSTKVETLIKAIQSATRNEVFFTDEIAQRLAVLATRGRSEELSPAENLTKRELDIFCLLAKGLTELEVAQQLGLHQRTITANKASLKDKLGISRPAEFTMLALKHKLITMDK